MARFCSSQMARLGWVLGTGRTSESRRVAGTELFKKFRKFIDADAESADGRTDTNARRPEGKPVQARLGRRRPAYASVLLSETKRRRIRPRRNAGDMLFWPLVSTCSCTGEGYTSKSGAIGCRCSLLPDAPQCQSKLCRRQMRSCVTPEHASHLTRHSCGGESCRRAGADRDRSFPLVSLPRG